MTNFYLITGFLGSGKTTFLKNLLRQIQQDRKIAVIQNEFAPNGIDGAGLKLDTPGFKLVEINNGSVFCACLMSSFVDSLKQILADYKPDTIFLEASGLADPSTLLQVMNDQTLQGKLIPAGTICLVDSLNYFKALHRMPGVVQQIRMADIVVVNKTDLVGENQLAEIETKIKNLNPIAKIEYTTYGIVATSVWETAVPNNNPFLMFPSNGSGRPNIQSAALKTGKFLDIEKLDGFLEELSSMAIRAKGFVVLSNTEVVLFQSVFGEYSVSKYPNYSNNTEITAIGENVTPGWLRGLFDKFSC